MTAIGVDLGGTNIRVGVVEPGRGIVRDIKHALTDRAPEAVADTMAAAVAEVGADDGTPIGIGIAAMLRGGTGVVVNAPNLGWRDVDLGGLVAARLPGRRVRLINDVDAIAFGEFRFGAGQGVADLLCIYAGTGIGGGIVAGGRLVTGATGITGEIGHTRVVRGPAARPCGCGARGCIEAYAGGRKIAERARAELAAGGASLAVEIAGGADQVHAGHLDEAVSRGDAYATALWDEIGPLFGMVVANAVTLLNPARVIMGGGVLWGAVELRRRVLESYAELVNAASGAGCEIVEARLGETAGILGSSALAAEG